MKTIILKIETKSIKKTLQMIVPIMGCEVYELEESLVKETLIRMKRWKHLKKRGE